MDAHRFDWARTARNTLGILLLGAVPALEPMSSEWARRASMKNTEAKRLRDAADVGLFRCHVSEPGLPVFTYELMPPASAAWEIMIFPSFSDAIVLTLDGQHWSISAHDHLGPDSSESVLGRVTRRGAGTLAPEAAQRFERLLDSALRTASPERYQYQQLDVTMLRLRDRSGRCAQLHVYGSGTRGGRVARLLDEFARAALEALASTRWIDGRVQPVPPCP